MSCVLFVVVVVVLSNDVIFGFVKVIQHRTQIVGIVLVWSRVESCLVGNYFDIFICSFTASDSFDFVQNISTKLFILESLFTMVRFIHVENLACCVLFCIPSPASHHHQICSHEIYGAIKSIFEGNTAPFFLLLDIIDFFSLVLSGRSNSYAVLTP